MQTPPTTSRRGRRVKRTTLKDVAGRAGVALSTASAILGDKPHCYASAETRQRVLDAARTLHYEPNMLARGLLGQQTFTIGLSLCHLYGPNIRMENLAGIERSAAARGYRIVTAVHNGDPEKEAQQIHSFLSQRVDGIILEIPTSAHQSWIESLVEEGMPTVLIDPPDGVAAPQVSVDRAHGGYLQVGHMLDRGLRRMVFMTATPNHRLGRAKNIGHQRALEAAGIDPETQLWLSPAPEPGSLEQAPSPTTAIASADGTVLMRKALRLGFEPDGIVTSSDSLALGAMRTLSKEGLTVPDDVAAIGFHDEMFSSNLPVSLSTIRHPQDVGLDAFELLRKQIEGEIPVKKRGELKIIKKPELIARESTAV